MRQPLSRPFRFVNILGATTIVLLTGVSLAEAQEESQSTEPNAPSANAANETAAVEDAGDVQGTTSEEASDFEVIMEAPLPEGFPGPGPVGEVIEKQYPAHRIARSEGGRAFGNLFRHITQNDVAMTTPVEMTMTSADPSSMTQADMGFYYEAATQGESGLSGEVVVHDEPALIVLSFGIAGNPDTQAMQRGRAAIQAALESRGDTHVAAGDFRLMGYNSPFVQPDKRFFELQLPIQAIEAADQSDAPQDTATDSAIDSATDSAIDESATESNDD